SNGLTWTNASSRDIKRDFEAVAGRVVLDKLAALPIQTWTYNDEADDVRHLGPVAEDFRAAFGIGNDSKSIATVDEEGVALAAVQGLYRLVQEKDQQIAARDEKIASLDAKSAEQHAKISSFELRLASLENGIIPPASA